MKALRLLGYLWSAPYGAIGFLAMLVFLLLGWIEAAKWRNGAWEVLARGPFARWMGRPRSVQVAEGVHFIHWAGFTLGWTIFFWRPPSERTLRHEHRHVDQALVLGIFMPFVWIVAVLIQGYHDSILEVDARKVESLPEGG